MSAEVEKLTARVHAEIAGIERLRSEIEKVIIGQRSLIERLLIGLFCGGHILIEGVPGLGKTLAASTLAKAVRASFQRIQFTPDLLPADLVGTLVYSPKNGDFKVHKGPIFHQIIVADEINRAPAKVQSAMLEAMEEKQVTIGESSFRLDDLFMVLATQNQIEHDGTYPLPEAQTDRFMLKVKVSYPSSDEELLIMQRVKGMSADIDVYPVLTPEDVGRLKALVCDIYMAGEIERYLLDLVQATRYPERYGLDLAPLILYGASPRASMALCLASKAHALLLGRGYVVPQDVKAVAPDVLRHRLILSYEAEAEEKTSDDLIEQILFSVNAP
jgi:MoxR-like ATPase